ncbi:MAG: hypothetical protein RLZ98_912 [Pseudomonadota bacterium]|jgi:two-component system cell cycle sensor histidine kinase PleC
MIHGTSNGNSNSLMSEYSSLLGDAILRHRTRLAEHSARIEAELASRVKSEFIANMSHELRTPLNTIIGFSKLLSEHDRRPLSNEDVIQYSHLINDAASHLLAVINDILDISKIQSGRYTLDSRAINIDEVLSACISSFQLMAKDAGITIVTDIPRDLPQVRGDAIKLRQIFTNLLGNAIKFSKENCSISIKAFRRNEGGVSVIVSDTGVGMTEDELLIALTPFGQVDGTRSRWREGTGLGLPIAKALIELHGGKLNIRSSKNVGTEVIVDLPPPNDVASSRQAPEA